MSVQFDENYGASNFNNFGDEEEKGITGFFIKSGIVKNKQQANYLMIGITVLILIVIFIIL